MTLKRTPDMQFVVLACDGIWDVKTNEEVVKFVQARCYDDGRTIANMQKGMEALLDDCCAEDTAQNGGLGCDNMTAVLVDLKPKN